MRNTIQHMAAYNEGYKNGYYDAKYLYITLKVAQLCRDLDYAGGYKDGQRAAMKDRQIKLDTEEQS